MQERRLLTQCPKSDRSTGKEHIHSDLNDRALLKADPFPSYLHQNGRIVVTNSTQDGTKSRGFRLPRTTKPGGRDTAELRNAELVLFPALRSMNHLVRCRSAVRFLHVLTRHPDYCSDTDAFSKRGGGLHSRRRGRAHSVEGGLHSSPAETWPRIEIKPER